MTLPAKQTKFEARFRLKVIVCANSINNCAAAARDYGISEKLVRDWKNKDTISKMAKKKCAFRHGKAQWPEIEEHLNKWIREHQQNGIAITRNNIRVESTKWARANPDLSQNFKAAPNWRAPPLDSPCELVAKSWDAILVEVITKSFKKCGISNTMDDEDDDMLWRSSDGEDNNNEDKDKASDSESDPYDDLHLSASHELDFEDNESSEESLENSGDGTESLESQKMTNPSSFIVPADIKPALVKHPPVDSLVENDDGSGMVLSANIITSSSNALPGTILPSSFSNTFSTASVHQSSQITGITDPTSILASSLNVGPSLCETSYGDQTQVIKCIKVSDECETFL
ncbi:Pogo transposable element-like 70 [Homarus americanus]|uniref:Pogo transposable element-like 70 n=1 Tax=Homarus americanus TaxID=6706 RepID=A0A8J5JWU5_HOMAM|nr:Pogo transposable element-like 70 [Homarus americanus]